MPVEIASSKCLHIFYMEAKRAKLPEPFILPYEKYTPG
jgi:hypothetical protein